MADQKQHAKITPEICRLRDRFDASKTVREKTQILADALRDARLDEAKWWEHLVGAVDSNHPESRSPDCIYCARIAALERSEA